MARLFLIARARFFPIDPRTYDSNFKVAGNNFQYFSRLMSFMGHYNHSLSVDAKIMVSKNFPIIGEQVAVNFVAQ